MTDIRKEGERDKERERVPTRKGEDREKGVKGRKAESVGMRR